MTEDDAAARLTALAAGERPVGRVLAADTTRDAVEGAFGARDDEPDAVGRFGGHPATFREYPGIAIAPLGVTAWFDGDLLLGIVVQQPELPAGWVESLGSEDHVEPSPVGRMIERATWDGHGVAVHRHRVTGHVERLDVFAAADPEWLADEQPIRRERRRRP